MKIAFRKIMIISMILMILIGNIFFSYGKASEDDWKQHEVSDYENADDETGPTLLDELQSAEIKSKKDAELFQSFYDAFYKKSPYSYTGENKAYIMDQLSTKASEVKDIIDGKREPAGSGDLASGKTQPWPNYENKIADAETDEEWREIYDSFATPNPPTDGMSDYMAEKYIKLVGQILKSGSFQIWADKNQSNAESVLRQKLIEVASNNNIDDSEALDILEENGADHGRGSVGSGSDTIYTSQPHKTDTGDAGDSLDDVMNDADEFIEQGQVQYEGDLSQFSNTIYNILLSIGIIVAVIVGAIIGVKLMASNIDTKVEAKKLLIPYVVGCVVVFGGFAIWKIVVTILQGM